jgi:hypothetical protein
MHIALLTDFWPAQGARREHICNGSVTDEQRGAGQKATQPSGEGRLRRLAALFARQVIKNLLLAHALPFASTCSRAVRLVFSTVS